MKTMIKAFYYRQRKRIAPALGCLLLVVLVGLYLVRGTITTMADPAIPAGIKVTLLLVKFRCYPLAEVAVREHFRWAPFTDREEALLLGCAGLMEMRRGNSTNADHALTMALLKDQDFSTKYLAADDADLHYIDYLLRTGSYSAGRTTSLNARRAMRETERLLARDRSLRNRLLDLMARIRVADHEQDDAQYPVLLADARQLLAENKNDPSLTNMVAMLARDCGDTVLAAAARDQALASLPDGNSEAAIATLYEKGTDLMVAGEYRQAIGLYQDLLRRGGYVNGDWSDGHLPNGLIEVACRDSLFGLARAHAALGETDNCIAVLRRTEFMAQPQADRFLLNNPQFAALAASDPGFRAFIAQQWPH